MQGLLKKPPTSAPIRALNLRTAAFFDPPFTLWSRLPRRYTCIRSFDRYSGTHHKQWPDPNRDMRNHSRVLHARQLQLVHEFQKS